MQNCWNNFQSSRKTFICCLLVVVDVVVPYTNRFTAVVVAHCILGLLSLDYSVSDTK